MNEDLNQDADQQARDAIAAAARDRAQHFAEQQAMENAEREYDAARQLAAAGVPLQDRRPGRRQHYAGPPPPPPPINDAAGDLAPAAPQSVTDTANAFAAVTQRR